MSVEVAAPSPQSATPEASTSWVASPYIHVGPDRVYNPHTDRTLLDGEPGYAELRRLLAGALASAEVDAETLALLSADRWVVSAADDLSRAFYLKYVALEANTHCNQSCYFCPVSVAPREKHLMPTELYERILSELAPYRATIEAVFMINYNEPTADPRFVDQVQAIRRAGLPPATLTNGTGLTPSRVDQLVSMGGLRFLSINLSTLDEERYREDRGQAHLPLVLRHVDYAATRPVAEQMDIVVLGTGTEAHRADFAAIRDRYAGSRFSVKYFEVNDRAGYLNIGLRAVGNRQRLGGCEYVGSRPVQHLHITPHAKAVLCCQDYRETVVVGDLTTQSVDEILTGPALAQARRWAYGVEEAPANFICRNCRYAILRQG